VRSEQIDEGIWQKTGCSITANQVTAPDGTFSGDLLTVTTVSNPNIFQDIGAFTSGTPYTGSVWVRAGNTSTAILQIFRNGGGDVSVTGSAIISGPGTITNSADLITVTGLSSAQWTRISVSGTPAAGGTLALYIKPRTSGATIGDTIYVWGVQLEAGAFATSYIPTTSATVTRSADIASVATSSFPYSSTEGSLVVACSTLDGSQVSAFRRPFALEASGSGSFQVGATYVYDGSAWRVLDQGETAGKHGVALKTNDFSVVANGGAARTGTGTYSGSDYNILRFGAGSAGSNCLNGHIQNITYIPRRLTNAELQARTA
jgi:hypothetical protein